MSWFLAFAGFAALIILHEFGHFLAAKACGMRVERFFLFFPPRLASVTRGETEYGIGAIPLGGFVKITGMNPDEELPEDVAPRAYYAQPVWKRIVVIAAGPAMNVLIAFLILFFLLVGFGREEPTNLAVGSVEDGAPAQRGLEQGDEIVAINGVPVARGPIDERQAERFQETFARFRCAGEERDGCLATSEATIVVERHGERRQISIPPFYDAAADRFRLGFSYQPTDFVTIDLGPAESAEFAVDRMWFVTSRTVTILARIFEAEQRRELSGVVGGYEVTRQSFEFDTRQALLVLAVISLSLAIINLFPFLPLDGGHIFWSLMEKLRGRPFSFSVMERASVVGFALVLMLFFIGLTNDIGRLTGEGFDVR